MTWTVPSGPRRAVARLARRVRGRSRPPPGRRLGRGRTVPCRAGRRRVASSRVSASTRRRTSGRRAASCASGSPPACWSTVRSRSTEGRTTSGFELGYHVLAARRRGRRQHLFPDARSEQGGQFLGPLTHSRVRSLPAAPATSARSGQVAPAALAASAAVQLVQRRRERRGRARQLIRTTAEYEPPAVGGREDVILGGVVSNSLGCFGSGAREDIEGFGRFARFGVLGRRNEVVPLGRRQQPECAQGGAGREVRAGPGGECGGVDAAGVGQMRGGEALFDGVEKPVACRRAEGVEASPECGEPIEELPVGHARRCG